MCHGNEKDCALFSRLCLELVMMQNTMIKKYVDKKDANVKRFKLLN